MKKLFYLVTILLLILSLILSTGCKKEATPTGDTSSVPAEEPAAEERPRGEALLDSELPFEKYIYEMGFYSFCDTQFPTLDLSKANGYYGEITINIIGDSISEGARGKFLYNNGYPALFKNSLNKTIDSNNWGFVIPYKTNQHGDRELHSFNTEMGVWTRETEPVNTPGFVNYKSNDSAGSALLISLDRRADGYDRHINGFYLNYSAGPTNGGFEVYVNDIKVYTVPANEPANLMARTDYIAIPDGIRNNLKIKIVKTDNSSVSINGITYAEQDGGVFVNTYARSGASACETEDSLLMNMCKANYVIFALGYNDVSIENVKLYTKKLELVVEACKESGATLICLDFLWPQPQSTSWGQNIRNVLFDAAKTADGYYIDFTDFYRVDSDYLLADPAHPSPNGYRLVARKLCYFFGIPFSSDFS